MNRRGQITGCYIEGPIALDVPLSRFASSRKGIDSPIVENTDVFLAPDIEAAKQAYKARWPRSQRQRYRIKTSFEPFRVKRRTLAWVAALLLRKRRGYRIIDRLFTLGLLGILYRLLRPAAKRSLPKFLRKSAMGIDSLFK